MAEVSPTQVAKPALTLTGLLGRVAGFPMLAGGASTLGGLLGLYTAAQRGAFPLLPLSTISTLGGLATLFPGAASSLVPASMSALYPGITAAGALGAAALPAAMLAFALPGGIGDMMKEAKRQQNAIRAVRQAYKNLPVSFQQLQAGAQAAQLLPQARTPEDLQRIADQTRQALSTWQSFMNPFLATGGQREDIIGFKGLPPEQLQKLTAAASTSLMDAIIANIRAQDALARMGAPLGQYWPSRSLELPEAVKFVGQYIPGITGPQLEELVGGLTPQQLTAFQPGLMEETLVNVLARVPGFLQSPIVQRAQQLTGPVVPLSPERRAQLLQAGQAAQQQWINANLANQALIHQQLLSTMDPETSRRTLLERAGLTGPWAPLLPQTLPIPQAPQVPLAE